MSASAARRRLVVVIFLALCAGGCGLLGGSLGRDPRVKIVMNPDSTAFAYAVDYHHYPGWFEPDWTAAARVEIWTYDLAGRKGPRKFAGWRHDPKASVSLLAWTAEGGYVAYDLGHGTVRCDRLDMRNGWRHSVGPVPWEYLRNERPRGVDPNHPDDYRRVRHVEERFGEFFLWDPATLKSILLFALPIDSTKSDLGYNSQSRETALRQDGVQSIADFAATPASTGFILHVHTFAKRPALFVRPYVLRLELTVPEPGEDAYSTIVAPEAFFDTTVAPNPAGERLDLYVPYERLLKVLRPTRALVRSYGSTYSGNLVATLIPDSLAGDDRLFRLLPGLRDGSVAQAWTGVEIPLH
jgi:hypothetical protein